MVPFIMMYKVVLTFKPVDKTLVFLTVQMKVAEQSYSCVIMLYKVVLTFKSVNETLGKTHSNENS